MSDIFKYSFLSYKLGLSESDLRRDIADKLSKKFPNVSFEERLNLAKESIETMALLGDRALYNALVEYGARLAIPKIQVDEFYRENEIKKLQAKTANGSEYGFALE